MLRKLGFLALRLTLIPFFVREVIQRRHVTIILYHELDPAVADIHFTTLRARYNIISLRDYVAARKQGTVDRLPPKSLIITFDDGHRSNRALKPVLARHGIPATLFVCSGIVNTHRHFWFRHDIDGHDYWSLTAVADEDRLQRLADYDYDETREYADTQALTAAELEDLKPWIDVQSHTVLHPVLPRCSYDRACREITQSKIDLERDYGQQIYALSYPVGYYSDRDMLLARRAGYECAITVDPGYNSARTDLFRLRRISMRDEASDPNEVIVKASGFWDCLRRLLTGWPYGYVAVPA